MSASRALAAIARRHEAARASVSRRYLRDLVRRRGAHDWATQTAHAPLSREEMNRRRAARRARLGSPASSDCAWVSRRCESVDAALSLDVEHGLCADRNEDAKRERENAENVRARRGLAKLLGETP